MPKKSAHFLQFLSIFVQKARISCNFLHFLTLFDTFLHFFTLFFLPVLPIYPNPTPQSLFLVRQQGFVFKSAKISHQNPTF